MTMTAPAASTSTAIPLPEDEPSPGSGSTTPAPTSGAPSGEGRESAHPRLLLAGSSLCILAAVLLGFVAELSVVGNLRQERDQRIAFSQLRVDLAKGTVPVAQTDADGKLVALGTPLAVFDIPALGVHQTMLEGTTASVLTSGPGHLRSSVMPGQAGVAVVMGRRAAYGGPFADIASLRPGQEVVVTTGQGVAKYRVTGIRRAGDPVPAAPAAGAGRLTMITAAGAPYVPSGAVRVDATLVTPAFETPSLVIGANGLAASEQAMASDSSAWIRLMLWAQALLLGALAITWAWARWGRWQAWVVGVPVLLFLGLGVAGQAALLLPNLM